MVNSTGKNYNPSPNSQTSNITTTTAAGLHHPPPPPPQLPHSTPTTRSEPNNPYPTTFVQADTSSFKQIVQMLTGSTEPARNPIPPIKTGPKKDKPPSKLYERRNSFKNFKINPLGLGLAHTEPGCFSGSPRPEILSPSILDFPSLVLSPVTPLIPDPFNRVGHRVGFRVGAVDNCNGDLDTQAEDKAIKEKGFYLHPSPSDTPRDSEPRLLPLFPVTSSRDAGSSNAADC